MASKSPARRGRPPGKSKSPAPSPVATTVANRRPLTSRSQSWAVKSARLLTRMNVPPNAISIASIFFACLAAYSFYQSPRESSLNCRMFWLAIGVPVGVLGRDVCHLLDAKVGVAGGKRSKSGELYNDVPGRRSFCSLLDLVLDRSP